MFALIEPLNADKTTVDSSDLSVDSFPAKLSYFNFHSLKVVSGYRDTQLQVG